MRLEHLLSGAGLPDHRSVLWEIIEILNLAILDLTFQRTMTRLEAIQDLDFGL